jgi:hypothetical protein
MQHIQICPILASNDLKIFSSETTWVSLTWMLSTNQQTSQPTNQQSSTMIASFR